MRTRRKSPEDSHVRFTPEADMGQGKLNVR